MIDHTMPVLISELNARSRLIINPSIFGFVRKMLDLAPAAFYQRPASTRHHALDERKEGGNLLHTIRVVDMVLIIADVCVVRKREVDVLIASAVLHDMFRHGIDGKEEHSCDDHPSLVREVAEAHSLTCDDYETILAGVENHMGRWRQGPNLPRLTTPRLTLSNILHLADSIDARWLENLA